MISCCRVLRSIERNPPVLGIGDHVAHIEIVRRDVAVIDELEAEIQQRILRVIDSAQEHSLVAHVAKSHTSEACAPLSRPAE